MVGGKKVDAGDLPKSYLQRPYYWSWGGAASTNASNRWPKKEDKLRRTTHRPKPIKILRVNSSEAHDAANGGSQDVRTTGLFTEEAYVTDFAGRSTSTTTTGHFMFDDVTSVLPTGTTTLDYEIDRKQPKWNFNLSIGDDSNDVNATRTSEVYVHNKTVILITGNTFLPKLFNETVDYGTFGSFAGNWSNGTDYEANFTGTVAVVNYDPVHLAAMVATAIVLGLIILATVIGNVFVIAAILLERNLQNVANYLILSLAVADLLVACLVMPLGAVYEVSKQWTLGPELCDMWTSSDVLCCTASILHLVAIALDRHWAVTNIDYIHQRTSRRIGLMILVIWAVAFLVCIAPMLGWKDPEWEDRIFKNQKGWSTFSLFASLTVTTWASPQIPKGPTETCLISQDIGYQVFATASSFYVPLFVILILYWRIFQTARKRIRRRGNQSAVGGVQLRNPSAGGVVAGAAGGSGGIAAAVVAVIGRPLPTISETTTAFTTVSSTNTSPEKQPVGNGVEPDLPTADCMSSYQQTAPYPAPMKTRVREAADSKRERKAAKTLAIITGAFVMCWLPFFILAILLPVCKTCDFNPYMVSFFLWLGYFNSTLNPIIYTIFSPEFRHAFKRLLCGRKGSIRRRNVRHFGQRHFQ